jgi:CHAT domain
MLLWHLGANFNRKFDILNNFGDSDRSLKVLREGIQSLLPGHPEYDPCLLGLSESLVTRFNRSGAEVDRTEAIGALKDLVQHQGTLPSLRVNAAELASQVVSRDDARIFLTLFQSAINAIPFLNPRKLLGFDQEQNIEKLLAFVSTATSLYISCGWCPVTEAFAILDLGRQFIFDFLLGRQPDGGRLRNAYPELAIEFEEIQARLDGSTARSSLKTVIATMSDNPDELREQFVLRIRQKPGFSWFLREPPREELCISNPVVVLHVSEVRSDAIIISATAIRKISLPKLDIKDVESKLKAFLRLTTNFGMARVSSMDGMEEILEWLWDTIVEPVLDVLRYVKVPSREENWPRIWWVPCGSLALLPLHAAGYHDVSNQSTIDRVISSYAPSVKSLTIANEKMRKSELESPPKYLLASMSSTAGHPDLAFGAGELSELKSMLPDVGAAEELINPLKGDFLSKLEGHELLHLCCHGAVDKSNPLKSELRLKDWQHNAMTVGGLMTCHLERAQFAFLHIKGWPSLTDYEICSPALSMPHLLYLAGYPAVVGTLWNVGESSAVTVASHVYSDISHGGELSVENSAKGLHKVTRAMRDGQRKEGTRNWSWAAFAHIGV